MAEANMLTSSNGFRLAIAAITTSAKFLLAALEAKFAGLTPATSFAAAIAGPVIQIAITPSADCTFTDGLTLDTFVYKSGIRYVIPSPAILTAGTWTTASAANLVCEIYYEPKVL